MNSAGGRRPLDKMLVSINVYCCHSGIGPPGDLRLIIDISPHWLG